MEKESIRFYSFGDLIFLGDIMQVEIYSMKNSELDKGSSR